MAFIPVIARLVIQQKGGTTKLDTDKSIGLYTQWCESGSLVQ